MLLLSFGVFLLLWGSAAPRHSAAPWMSSVLHNLTRPPCVLGACCGLKPSRFDSVQRGGSVGSVWCPVLLLALCTASGNHRLIPHCCFLLLPMGLAGG